MLLLDASPGDPGSSAMPPRPGQESFSQAHICTNACLTAHSRGPAKRGYFKLPGWEHFWWEQPQPASSRFSKKGKARVNGRPQGHAEGLSYHHDPLPRPGASACTPESWGRRS